VLFDSHTHLQFPQFDGDREGVISRLLSADIKVINVGTDLEDSKKAIELAKKYLGQMWATVGLHPNDAVGQNFDISKYKKLAENDSVVAIGECGLDYFRTPDDDKNRQKDIFLRQLESIFAQTCRYIGKVRRVNTQYTPNERSRGNFQLFLFCFQDYVPW